MNLEEWINKLQGADDATKSRWLILGSVCAMIVVVALWMLYIQSVVRPASPTNQGEPASTSEQQMSSGPSLLARFANAVDDLFSGIFEGMKAWVTSINLSHSVIIKP